MIKILFFAALRERLDCEQYLLSCESNTLNVASVLSQLQSRCQNWQQELSRTDLLCALNQQLVPLTASVQDGDELAFFPPVTGG
ncbi:MULTISPECIES: MoaD/ThiS family protein [unclassified Arsukibacterium]|uniref:MoaD/ThiS family protein n=1 Tax=unclassified Arsukibacterium TaxID=2635278 RepID=UPI000C88FE7C|nr:MULTISPECIES: MoaD/ThiS family protein [unclassified Arsukibacterium]MAA94344.1 molybdopterin synthase sulfur carrier subunit [Rheinheimera sp.]MDX1538871.1 MoaD/ThiS family protein [Arsukibacterium sp.]HAW91976.1 molybdopterin synthase sulfur carrier subunit [Candidatus Azambacteria bacterium]|tara:strand:- start:11450 stop:11701 length:252 start_codon:yes stop_codon:yes gene_type:complete